MSRILFILILAVKTSMAWSFLEANHYEKVAQKFGNYQQIWVIPSHWNEKPFADYSDRLVVTERDRSPENSVGDIVKAIREEKASVLVCVHKSSMDCLSALLLYPELSKRLKAFVSLNGRVYGTEFIKASIPPPQPLGFAEAKKMPLMGALKYLYHSFIFWMNPHWSERFQLTPQARKNYMTRHQQDIQILSENLEILWTDTSLRKYGVLKFGKKLELNQ